MPVTSTRGTLRAGESVYRQLSFWLTGGAPHSMRVVKLSPVYWQVLYGESHLLRGARISQNRYHEAVLHVPIAGIVFEVVAATLVPENSFVVSDGYWDPSTGS